MCGVPQDSVLGPTLWNVFNEGLLRVVRLPGVSLIGFADDFALMVLNHTEEGIERTANEAPVTIENWIRTNGLELVCEKSEAMVLSKKLAYRTPRILCGGDEDEVKRRIKYFGVMLDSKDFCHAHEGSSSNSNLHGQYHQLSYAKRQRTI